ncbi:hypothetical protein L1987_15181 [Smallanthus sonchifolius]|uniref:Uncharacterized protein n=1 Tax=Smallanthus sonchifolius TaxID=185202 RepID=A0ACB9J7F5_9ASTR|nr:hypothetical protein L1987_15181 [Smallanthus sonchifolius]
MMGYPIEEYPDEDTQSTGDINSIYVCWLFDQGREDRALLHQHQEWIMSITSELEQTQEALIITFSLADSARDEALPVTTGHGNGILLWIMAIVALVGAFIYYF